METLKIIGSVLLALIGLVAGAFLISMRVRGGVDESDDARAHRRWKGEQNRLWRRAERKRRRSR